MKRVAHDRARRTLVALGVVVLISVSSGASDDPAVAGYQTERAATIERLRAFATWCASDHNIADRNRGLEAVLALEPEDQLARRTLGYVRDKEGRWKKPAWSAPRTSDKNKAKEAARRFEEAVAAFRAAVGAVCDTAAPVGVRERAREDLVCVLPDDADARAGNREVKLDDQWVLEETAAARTRGPDLRALANETLGVVPAPEAIEATSDEARHGGPYPQSFSNGMVRVFGARGTSEAAACARIVSAMRGLYEPALSRSPPPAEFRAFLFPDLSAGLAAISADPRFGRGDIEFARRLQSIWAPKDCDVYVWAPQQTQVEWTLRQSFQLYLRRDFKITESRGFAYEGFGHWFSGALLASHRVFFVARTDYAGGSSPVFTKLDKAGADWTAMARDTEASPDWPGLRLVLGRDVNQLTPGDLLMSFMFARFLIEGRQDACSDVLGDIGVGTSADAWCDARLDATVEGLESRLRRFVREIAAIEAAERDTATRAREKAARGSAPREADPSIPESVGALVARLQSSNAADRRDAIEHLRKVGAAAIPAILAGVGHDVGSVEWKASLAALVAIGAAEALAQVESCRSQWKAFGWLAPTELHPELRVVDVLKESLIAERQGGWSKSATLRAVMLDDPFLLPPWVVERLLESIPSRFGTAESRVREKDGNLQIDSSLNGYFSTTVDPSHAAVVAVGVSPNVQKILVFRRLDAWYAAPVTLLRGKIDNTSVEILDVEADGDFSGPADLVRFGDGGFRAIREGDLAWNGSSLIRFRVRREAKAYSVWTMLEPEPSWMDPSAMSGMASVYRWRAAAGLAPGRIDSAKSRSCGLHHEYWRHNGFGLGLTAHEEYPSRPYFTEDGHLAGRLSSCWPASDGAQFISTIGGTVLHRSSLLGRPEDGVGLVVGDCGSLLWGGEIDASTRGFPLLVPGAGQIGVPSLIVAEVPAPSDNPDFYARGRGYPVSVTWSGIKGAALEGAHIELFEETTRAPLGGTMFSAASPYHKDYATGFPAESVIFVADDPLRAGATYTARYRGRGQDGAVEFTWQFRVGK